MAIINPKAPAAGKQIVSENLGQILSAQTRGAGALLRDFRTDELAAAEPHQTYFVALKDLAAGHLLDAARLTGWRYLIIQGNNAVAEVELNADEKVGKPLEFIGFHQSTFANATLEALRRAEDLSQVKKQDYELRYVKIPSVYFAAVWLHWQSDDILIPLLPTPPGLKANQPYSQKQIVALLKSAALAAAKFDAGFERSQGKPPKT